ncbi:transcriptional regulator [Halomicrobium zhouii]|uniref:Transcriptional regulator n=1 Tax=Halomicrobium zhouii TaxID=767519 RepID=A0A1I6LTI4_9EURY|nr:TrmB family transcriptional regulator [Halomicrobium zhouii]SFS06797.1 transcriptional regulator [Halomicrobium zhouii]
MKDSELIQILEDAGLSPYQSEAYVTLLALGNASATDVADACDVPDPRIYDVLRDLEAKGYVETYQQDSLTARAHDPDVVLDDLRSRSSEYLDAAEEIEERWNEPAVTEHEVSIVKRFDTVMNRAKTLVGDAETQIQFAGHVDQFRSMTEELAAAHERGVTVKISLWSDEGKGDLPDEAALEGVCTEARYRDLPSPFVVIVDRTSTSFAPNQRSTNEYGVLVSDRTYTFVFHWFFLTALWESWDTIYTARTADTPTTYVDIRYAVRDLETLLNEGATVEVTVQGYEMETNDPTEVHGVVTDVTFSGDPTENDQQLPLSHLAGRVSLTVDTGSDVVDVGGWGAILEEIEAESITIDDVQYE